MAIVQSTIKNGKIATSFGVFNFVEGKADIPDEAAEQLTSLPGFYYDDGRNAPKPPEQTPADKEDKQEDSNAHEAQLGQSETQEDEADKPKFDEKDLNSKNVAQLRKIAKDNGIEIGDATKKDEIIAILMA